MLQLLPLAGLALAPLAHARLGRFPPRMGAENCCPCSPSGQAIQEPTAITVTQPAPLQQTTTVTQPAAAAPEKTVIIEHTVTAPANTVYITAGSSPEPITKTVTPEGSTPSSIYEQSPSTYEQPSSVYQQAPQVVTVTSNQQQQPAAAASTSTVSSGYLQIVILGPCNYPEGPSTVTIGASSSPVESSGSPTVVTVTQVPSEAPQSAFAQGPQVITNTISGSEPVLQQAPETVALSPVTKVQTVTLPGGSVVTQTVKISSLVTVTASPQIETVSVTPSTTNFQTVTQTVSNGGNNINVQIIIINLETGESTCRMRNSGKPCSGISQAPQPQTSTPAITVCTSVAAPTSIVTAYNTIIVTANNTMKWNATAMSGVAMPSG